MSTILTSVQEAAVATRDRAFQLVDGQLPPQTRQNVYNQLRQWTNENPRLAGFVIAQLTLSGPPLAFFVFFAFSTLTVSLLTCTVLALVSSLAFTAICVGTALLILIPTLIVSTISATFLFTWAFLAYAIVQRFSSDPRTAPYADAAKDTAYNTAQRVRENIYGASRFASDKANSLADGIASGIQSDGKRQSFAASEGAQSETLDNSTTAVRDYFTGINGSGASYGTKSGVISADTSKSSGLITPGGTLPRNRSYSRGSSTSHKLRTGNGGIFNETMLGENADVVPMDIAESHVVDHGLPRPVQGAIPSEVGSLRNGVVSATS